MDQDSMLTMFLQCRGSVPVDYSLTILVVVIHYLGRNCTYAPARSQGLKGLLSLGMSRL